MSATVLDRPQQLDSTNQEDASNKEETPFQPWIATYIKPAPRSGLFHWYAESAYYKFDPPLDGISFGVVSISVRGDEVALFEDGVWTIEHLRMKARTHREYLSILGYTMK